MPRHVPKKDQSAHAKKRKRANLLVPFNLFATKETLKALNQMAREQGYPSRAEMFRQMIREKLAQHNTSKAVVQPEAEHVCPS